MKDSIYGASPADVLHEIAVGSTAASSRNIYTISQWSHMKERNAWHSWHCLFSGPCSKIRSWDRNGLSLDGPVRTRSFKYTEHFCGPNTSCWGIFWNIILSFVFLVSRFSVGEKVKRRCKCAHKNRNVPTSSVAWRSIITFLRSL